MSRYSWTTEHNAPKKDAKAVYGNLLRSDGVDDGADGVVAMDVLELDTREGKALPPLQHLAGATTASSPSSSSSSRAPPHRKQEGASPSA